MFLSTIIALVLGVIISTKVLNKEPDDSFSILSKTKNGNITTYEVMGRGYAGKKGEMSFEEAGQGAGIGDVSGVLAVVCVEDLPLLVHHKAGGQLQLVALVGTVLVACGSCFGNLQHRPGISHLGHRGRRLDAKALIQSSFWVTQDGEGEGIGLQLLRQPGGVGLQDNDDLTAYIGDLMVVLGQLMDVVLAEGAAVVA